VAREMFEEWLVSPPHRTNIEGDFNAVGVGAVMGDNYEWYAVQLFAKRVPPDIIIKHHLVKPVVSCT
jgi:hypothetical protein